MPDAAALRGLPREPGRPSGLWLGPTAGAELEAAHECLAERLDLVVCGSLAEARARYDGPTAARGPAYVFLAADRPGRWSLDTAVAAVRRWPLAVIVGVATSLGEGRRRSGPAVPGIETVAWHELPGRLECWLAESARGLAGAAAVPATARREERLLESLAAVAGLSRSGPAGPVAIAGGHGADVDGLADLLTAAGRQVAGTTRGRPPLDTEAPLLVWDAVTIEPADLAWLRMLAANRAGLGVVLLDSFPRGDTTRAALRAGAAAVLGRPLTLETLAGTLLRLDQPGGTPGTTGLGARPGRR